MYRSRALALSLLPLLALACPTETSQRPPSHQIVPSSQTRAPAGVDCKGDPDCEKEQAEGLAALVDRTAADAKHDADAAGHGADAAAAPPTPPAPGDIPAPPDVAAPPASATTTASGLAYRVLTKGTGTAHPQPYDRVEVHYSGWTTDGKMFDSSRKRGRPATFGVGQVIKGWTEGLQLMSVGDSTRFWIPVELAYNNAPGKPAGMLVFDVELLGITEGTPPPPPPETPVDVAAPPASATTTASGLAYRVLTKGTGKTHPTETSRVTVHYSGWTTDGELFDSSTKRGTPATFPLNRVIKGWTEGLQLMVEGEKSRFWIPVDLAYDNAPGKPAGMLVFDVQLVSIDG